MASIAIYIGRHACTAPRPCKEADALAEAGHQVTMCGLWSDPRLVARDQELLRGRAWQFRPYLDCRVERHIGRLRWLAARTRNRIAREIFRRTGAIRPDVFGYGTRQLTQDAKRRRADLTIFHSEGGLWAAQQLHAIGRKTGVDFEDWFSHDLPPSAQSGRPIAALMQLESAAVRSSPYVTTTSHALAKALSQRYDGPEPTVIYNTFPRNSSTFDSRPRIRKGAMPVSLHWFSQTLGPSRGLETLFSALPHVRGNWTLELRADDPFGYESQLRRTLPTHLSGRVTLVPTVPNGDLPARIAEHDVGLALDVSDIPSRNLTITNKLFQYLESGLAVVASDTAGHQEVLRQAPAAGEIFSAGNTNSLAEALSRMTTDPARLAAAKLAAVTASGTVFAHERQSPLYAALVDRSLHSA